MLKKTRVYAVSFARFKTNPNDSRYSAAFGPDSDNDRTLLQSFSNSDAIPKLRNSNRGSNNFGCCANSSAKEPSHAASCSIWPKKKFQERCHDTLHFAVISPSHELPY